jgi:mannose-6-phosphate isomerase-like protein (cupin superfamily)
MGLYGTIIVEPSDPEYWPAVDRQLSITLDDLLVEDGRIGPQLHLHGAVRERDADQRRTEFSGEAAVGEVLRLYLVNTANTRIFNFALPGARMKLVGGDSGRYERETFIDEVMLAPSERVVLDVAFDRAGQVRLEHRTPDRVYDLGAFAVGGNAGRPEPSRSTSNIPLAYTARRFGLREDDRCQGQRTRGAPAPARGQALEGGGIKMGTATATFGTGGRTALPAEQVGPLQGIPNACTPLAGWRRRTPRARPAWLVSDPCPTSLSATGGSRRGKAIQEPLHVHRGSEEPFICLEGQLEVEVDGLCHEVDPGTFIVLVEPFTPSPLGKETHLLAVMSREIAELIDRLHEPTSAADSKAPWGHYRSSLA